jgi:hypothetical protein
VGEEYSLRSKTLVEVWRAKTTSENSMSRKTDFTTEPLIGVSTDYRFVTTVKDLENGTTLLVVDNSDNFGSVSDWHSEYAIFVSLAIAIALLVCFATLIYWRRSMYIPAGSLGDVGKVPSTLTGNDVPNSKRREE